jgi:hypothetical protein
MTYGMPERAAMLVLMAVNREVRNAELKGDYKIDLKASAREKLNREGLIKSRKQGGSFFHELTEKGWAWARAELSQSAPPRSGSLGGALYAVMNGLGAGLERHGLTLADLFGGSSVATPEVSKSGLPRASSLADQVKAAYRQLAKQPHDWIYLSALRPLINGASKAEVDSALKEMYRHKQINLTLKEDQKTLTAPERAAAIRLGVADMHLISME